jgi:hypothetical protein
MSTDIKIIALREITLPDGGLLKINLHIHRPENPEAAQKLDELAEKLAKRDVTGG